MTFFRFMKDKALLLLANLIGMALLFAFLRLTSYPLDDCVIVLACWALALLTWLLARFFSRKKYFSELEKIMEDLEQRYLLGELMPRSFRLEDELYRELICKSNKSVIERIHQIEDAQKEYREYVESWVHEIKAPITSIALACENARDERGRRIAAENRRVENDVDMALYYARSNEVYKDYLIAETDLQEVCGEVLIKNKHFLIENHVRAEVDCPHHVFTDKKWIDFIVGQLVLNGAKYRAAEGACLRIFTEAAPRSVLLTVEDNGVGIKPEELSRIFEKGFTGSNGRKEGRATGMGLYLCQKLCGKLGIEIRAESEVGRGTRVILEIPRSDFAAIP